MEEQYALGEHSTIKAGVDATIEFLGMSPCEGTQQVPDRVKSHTVLLAGVYVGGCKVLARANVALAAEGEWHQSAQLGTSMISLVLAGPYAYVAHLGNCRAYLVRRGAIEPLTSDHTLGMKKVHRGELTRQEYETHSG